ncbi:hypothetical protein ACOME3_005383 [Neoechinorhynchus agilis]
MNLAFAIQQPEQYNCTENETITLRCHCSRGGAQYCWTKNSQPIDFNERVVSSVDDQSYSLTIHQANSQDSGTYTISIYDSTGAICDSNQCRLNVGAAARRSLPPERSLKSHLQYRQQQQQQFRSEIRMSGKTSRAFSMPPRDQVDNRINRIVKPLKSQEFIPGKTKLVLLHVTTLLPISRVDFFKDNNLIIPSDPRRRVTVRGCCAELALTNPDLHDAGSYACRIDGAQMSECSLQPLSLILNRKLPNRIDAEEGEPITLECEFNQSPSQPTKWFKDNHEISIDESGYKITSCGSYQALTIERTDREKHSGRYRLFINDLVDETYLMVVPKKQRNLGFAREPPEIVQCDSVGDSVVIPCEVQDPNCTTQWFMGNNRQIFSDEKSFSFNSHGIDRSLTVRRVSTSGQSFKCVINGANEEQIERTTRVSVKSSHVTAFATSPDQQSHRVHRVLEGDTVTIAISDAKLGDRDILLLKDGYPFERKRVGTNTIILEDLELEDSGYYSFVSDNSIEHPIGQIIVDRRPIQREFMSLPRSSFVAGETIYLECEFQNEPRHPVVWHKNSIPLYSNDHAIIRKDGLIHSLTIHNCARSDEGTYELRCGSFILTTPYINVIDPLDQKNVQILKEGDTLNIDVKTNTLLDADCASLRLFHDNDDITKNQNVLIDIKKSSLAICIQDVTFADSGSYYMETDGCRLHLCTVQVVTPNPRVRYVPNPFLTKNKELQRVPCGSDFDVVFESSTAVQGDPVWIKDDHELNLLESRYSTEVKQNRLILTINGLLSIDSGTYGVRTRQGVEIYAPPLHVYESEVRKILETRTAFVDDRIEVEIGNEDGLVKEVTVLKNGKPVEDRSRFHLECAPNRIKFTISSLKLSDAGLYEISVGDNSSKAHYIFTVNVEPRKSVHVQKLRLDRSEFNEGETITIDCVFERAPSEDLHWYRNQKIIDENDCHYCVRHVDPKTFTLVIKNCSRDDNGVYQLKNETTCFETPFLKIKPSTVMTESLGVMKISPQPTVTKNRPTSQPEQLRYKVAGGVGAPESVVTGKIVERIIGDGAGRCAKLVEAKEGESINIQLDTKGELLKDEDVFLLHNGQRVFKTDPRVMWVIENTSLSVTISDLVLSDAGLWAIVLRDQIIPAIDLVVNERPRQVKLLHLKKTVFQVDETFRLDVEVKGRLSGTPIWRKNGKIIKDGDPIQLEHNDKSGQYTLLIPRIQNEHSGIYSLTLDNLELLTPPITVRQRKTIIQKSDQPPLKIIHAVEGDTVTLKLPASWMQEDVRICKDHRIVENVAFETEGDSVVVRLMNVGLNDSGVYCLTELGNRTNVPFVELRVTKKAPTKFCQLQLVKTLYQEGETLSIPYKIPSQINDWSHNGQPLASMDRVHIDEQAMHVEELNLDDAGIYSIIDPDGTLHSTSSITVRPGKPHVTVQCIEAYEHENIQATLKLSSDMKSFIKPTNVILREGIVTDKAQIHSLLSDDTFLIKISHLQLEDSGLYEIQLDDGDRLPFLRMNVMKRPMIYKRLELPKTIFTEGDTLVIKLEHESVIGEVPVWTKDNKPLNPDDRVRLSSTGDQSTLTISPLRVSDGGDISVSIGNVMFNADPLVVHSASSVSVTAEDEDDLKFVIPFHLAIKPERRGDTAEFRCSFNRKVDPKQVAIVREETETTCDARFNVMTSEGGKCFTFRMTDTQPKDAGAYQCCAPPLLSQPVYLKLRSSIPVDIPFVRLSTHRNHVIEGETIEVECDIGKGIDITSVSLFKSDQAVNDAKAEIISKSRAIFRIPFCEWGVHDGDYHACAEYKGVTVESGKVNIQIEKEGGFVSKLGISDTHPNEGDMVELKCKIKGAERVHVTKNGLPVNDRPLGICVQGDTVSVKIPEVNSTDIGEYRLVIPNTDSITSPAKIIEVKKPSVKSPLILSANKLTLNSDEILILNCQRGIEQIRWMKGGTELDGDSRYKRELIDSSIEIFIVSDLKSSKDTGDYYCETVNGVQSNVLHIEVIDQPTKRDLKFIKPLTANQNVLRETEELVLSCALSLPEQRVVIMRDGMDVSDTMKVINGTDYVLRVPSVRVTDSGSYQAIVNDGELVGTTVPIRIDPISPEIRANGYSFKPGTMIELTCVHPDAKSVKWYKDGIELPEYGSCERLVISSAKRKDEGQYSCSVNGLESNKVGIKVSVLEDRQELVILRGLRISNPRPVEGESVSLDVTLNRPLRDNESFEVYKDGLIYKPGRIDRSTICPSIEIPAVTCSDTGEFKVIVDKKETSAPLNVQKLKSVLTSEKNVLKSGETLKLFCEFNRELSAEELSRVELKRNNAELLAHSRNFPDKETIAYTVENMEVGDSGTFICELDACRSNSLDVVINPSQGTALQFASPLIANKSFLQAKERLVLSLKLNRTACFEDIQFLRDGKLLQPDRLYLRPSNELCYVIEEASKTDGPGCYECKIIPTGQTSNSVSVNFDDNALSIIEPLQDTTVSSGSSLNLFCRFSKPLPPSTVFKWLKDDKEIELVNGVQAFIENDLVQIKILHANPLSHQGVWRCMVTIDNHIPLMSECVVNVKRPSVAAQGFARLLPASMSVPLSSTLTLECETLKPEKDVKWTRDGKPIEPSENVSIDSSRDNRVHRLVVGKSKPEDGALYACVLPINSQQTACKVNVAKEPINLLSGFPAEITAVPGDRVNLSCVLSAPHVADIVLEKNGEPVDSLAGTNVQRVDSDDDNVVSFMIKPVRKSDAGLFTLLGPDGIRTQCQLKVLVDEQPRITKPLVSKTVNVGSTVCFEAQTSSALAPVFWKKDGKPINSEGDALICSKGNQHQLILNNAQFEDTGTISFEIGEDISKAALQVVQDKSPEVFIDSTIRINPQPAMEGDDIEVSCTITDTREAKPVWWRGTAKNPVNSDRCEPEIVDQHHARLMIRKCIKEDEDVYGVRLDNGDEISGVVEIVESPCRFVKELENVRAAKGDRIVLKAETNKEVAVQWLKDGKVVQKSGPKQRQHSFEIPSVEKDAIYKCMVNDRLFTTGRISVAPEQSAISIIRKLQDVYLNEGEPLLLQVELNRKPNSDPLWKRDGKPVDGAQTTADNNEFNLTKPSMNASDSGTYEFDVDGVSCICKVVVTKSPLTLLRPLALVTGPQGIEIPIIGQANGFADVVIDSLDISDKGKYRVEAIDDDTKVHTSYILNLSDSEVKADLEGPTEVDVGDSVELICSVNVPLSGKEFEWKFQGQTLKSSPNLRISHQSQQSKLLIPKCTKQNHGLYECVVAGKPLTKHVNVTERSISILEPLELYGTILEGSDVSLQAKLDRPADSVKFYKDGKPIDDANVWNRGSLVGLDLSNLTPGKDEGVYEIEADGIRSQYSLQDIPVEQKEVLIPLRLERPLFADKARPNKGENVTLRCKLNRRPIDERCEWFFNDKPISIDGIKYIVDYGQNGEISLKVNGCDECDGGRYCLKVANISTNAQIEVIGISNILSPLTYTPQPVKESDNLQLKCKVDPKAEPKWLKDGKPLKGGKVSSDGLAVFEIPKCKQDDSGVYELVVGDESSKCSVEVLPSVLANQWVKKLFCGPLKMGEVFTLSAQSKFPCNKVEWELNGKRIIAKTKVEGCVYTIEIHPKSIVDYGDFVIKADNLKDSLNVQPQNEFTKSLEERDESVLSCCTLLGGTVTWFKNGQPLNEKEYSIRNDVLENEVRHSLTIPSGFEREGEYVCQVDDLSDSCKLGSAIKIGEPVIDGACDEGKRVKVRARCNGKPGMKGKLVDQSNGKVLAEGVLKDRELVVETAPLQIEDSGKYALVIEGSKSPVVQLKVKPKPLQFASAQLKVNPEIIDEGERTKAVAIFNKPVSLGDCKWKLNGIPVELDDRHRECLESDTSISLEMTNCKVTDSGRIVCALSDSEIDGRLKVNPKKKETVEEPLQLIKALSIVGEPIVGSTIKLNSTFSRKPKFFKFFKDDDQVDASRLNLVQTADGKINFELTDCTENDSGVYKVVAEDTVESICLVRVKKQPLKIVKELHLLKRPVLEGDPDCYLSVQLNREPVSYKWLKNSEPIDIGDKFMEKQVAPNEYQLMVKSPNSSDSGNYEFLAGEGNVRSVEAVQVRSPPLQSLTPLHFEPANPLANVEPAILSLTLNRLPTGKPRLLRNGKPLTAEPVVSDGYAPGSKCFTYEFPKLVRPDDEGVYTFEVDNFGENVPLNLKESEPSRVISGPPKQLEIKHGDRISLSCLLSEGPPLNVEWISPDNISLKKDFAPQTTFKSILEVPNVVEDCVFKCKVGDEAEFETRVIVRKPPKEPKVDKYEFVVPLSNRTLTVGAGIQLSCILNRAPTEKPVWKLNGIPVGDRFHCSVEDEWLGLYINSIEPSDKGNISCEVHGVMTTAELFITEIYNHIARPLKHIEVYEGEDAIFTTTLAEVDNTVKWSKDGNDIEDRLVPLIQGKAHQLKIPSAKLSDQGWYKAEFDDLMIFTQAKLRVLQRPLLVLDPLVDVTVEEGEKVELVCRVKGLKDNHEVVWTKGGLPVKEYGGRKAESVLGKEGLLKFSIPKAKMTDAGGYKVEVDGCESQCRVIVNRPGLLFMSPLEDKRVMEHENTDFECTLSRTLEVEEIPHISWSKDNHLISPDKRILPSVFGNVLRLTIRDSRKLDEGAYTVRLPFGLESTANLVVEMADARFLSPLPKKLMIRPNEPFKLAAIVSNDDVPVEWLKDGMPIDPALDLNPLDDKFSHSLESPTVKPEQGGLYTVRLPSGEESSCLCVFEDGVPPRIIVPFNDVEVNEMDEVVLRCKTENQVDEVEWFLNGVRLLPGPFLSLSRTEDEFELKVKECYKDDQGEYACKVSNPHGSDTCKASVKIIPTDKVKDQKEAKLTKGLPPYFIQTPTDIAVNEGQVASLSAVIAGRPDPEVTWLHGKIEIEPVQDKYEPKNEPANKLYSLIIRNIEDGDVGEYSCVAKNPFGQETAWANLSITHPVEPVGEKQMKAPYFIRKPRNTNVCEGQSVKFDMFVGGDPEITIKWLKDGEPLGVDRIRLDVNPADNGKATMAIEETDLSDTGSYEVMLENPAGTCRCNVQLTVEPSRDERKKRKVMFALPEEALAVDRPLPPTAPFISALPSDRGYKLSWEHSKSRTPDTPLTYIVEVKEPASHSSQVLKSLSVDLRTYDRVGRCTKETFLHALSN